MFNAFRNYINGVTSAEISDEEFKHIEEAFTPRTIKKRQFLLHEGSVCKYMSFIIKGAMRQYCIDEKGNEHIVGLGIEGWWISDRGSFINLTPSKYNIDAVEDTELLITTLEKINILKERSSSFFKMAHILDQNSFVASQKRIEASISYTAEEKFMFLLETTPKFVQRFPQNMLASYLGLTPETLSRVRKSLLAK
jgi:CRP-like cAMP-binding protein